MQISLVIPTVDRKTRLLSLLVSLDRSTYPIHEVIIVDSGNDRLASDEYSAIKNFPIYYISSERSVCIQRNTGIRQAKSEWIFLCDDDIEIPADYLQKLSIHIDNYPGIGAISGLWLQKNGNAWTAGYPETSAKQLLWKYIFSLGIWGPINCSANNLVIRKIKQYYQHKGNHITKAGWPVITDLSSDHFFAPVYSLGGSLVKKEWLLNSPFDEVLDRHGIGENYGVIAGFPDAGIHVLNSTCVYHQHETINRLMQPLQYYRRVLTLDYFIQTKKTLKNIKRRFLLWSLIGNMISFIFSGNRSMRQAGFKSMWDVLWNKNPYPKAAKNNKKIIEPVL
jgi:glycosyltransferase involved in cell wall biosynthesis